MGMYAGHRRPGGPFVSFGCLGFILVTLIVLVGLCAYPFVLKQSAKHQVVTIKGKESVSKDDGHEYRVYTRDQVFVVKDSLVFWNWRAADRYNMLEVGKSYDCLTAGWRVGFFSAFPNLISCKEVVTG